MLNNTLTAAQSVTGGLCAQPGRLDEKNITGYEYRLFRDFIHGYCGIYFDEPKTAALASKLAFRMDLLGINSYMEYYNHLRFSPGASEEMADLVPHLTNNETYFFREMNQLGFLVSEFMERIRSGRLAQRPLRVLSCGCSSGEEPLTIAMLLEEAGMYARGCRIDITGIDIDRKAIEKASQGGYTSYSLRAAEKALIGKYFRKEADRYVLDEKVRGRVSFRRGNLLERATFSAFKEQDVILCRNVFIYFSDSAIKTIAEHFYDSLSSAGMVLLGHSESLSRITDIFQPMRSPGIIYYKKREY